MTSPHDSPDNRLEVSLKQALKTSLPESTDKRIRTHLSQQTVPGSAPRWVTDAAPAPNGVQSESIFTHRFSVLSMAAAILLTAVGTYLIFSRVEREAAPKIVEPVPPPKAKSKPESREFSPDELWKNGENVATRSAFPGDPIQRAKADALLLRLRDAAKQRDYETVDKVTRELQELLSPQQK